jgi:hypothetical protein
MTVKKGNQKYWKTSMSQRPKHACFYSKKCQYSKSFLEELARTPYTSEFQFVCVDPAPNRPKLPSWLKVVPTLLIDGEPDPLTDEKVFNWLSLRKIQGRAPAPQTNSYREPPRNEIQSRQDAPVQMQAYDPTPPPPMKKTGFPEPIQTRAPGGEASKQVAVPGGDVDPLAWHGSEMSGTGKWSDGYSFIEDEFSIADGKGASRIERNFALLDGMGYSEGGAQKTAPPAEKVSQKAQALNSAMEDFKKKRDMDLPASITRI